MTQYQVNYGDGWEDVPDEARVKRVLADHYGDAKYPLDEMRNGRQIRTTFAAYRINPAYLSALPTGGAIKFERSKNDADST